MKDLKKYTLPDTATGRDALRTLDNNSAGITGPVLFVTDQEGKVRGSLSDGDIRRGLLNDRNIDDNVMAFARSEFRYVTKGYPDRAALKKLKALNIRFVPLLDHEGRLADVIDNQYLKSVVPLSALLMAGGKGERLRPLTLNTPKPLLKVGDKPIIQYNVELLASYGISELFISVNYLGDQIRDFLGDGSRFNVNITYLEEDFPLGTIGPARKISALSNEHLLLMNSDLLTDIDLESFFDCFLNEKADLAVASIPYPVNVPYAVLEVDEDKRVTSFREKPKYVFYSNGGIYIFKKELISLIPEGVKYDATEFMDALLEKGKKIVSDAIRGYWLDIGKPADFYRAQEDIKHLRF